MFICVFLVAFETVLLASAVGDADMGFGTYDPDVGPAATTCVFPPDPLRDVQGSATRRKISPKVQFAGWFGIDPQPSVTYTAVYHAKHVQSLSLYIRQRRDISSQATVTDSLRLLSPVSEARGHQPRPPRAAFDHQRRPFLCLGVRHEAGSEDVVPGT
jgi:hypothetical protein